ncbi:FliI/YscN family ATPase [Hyphomonas pacifica]|uniref:FliI/YscN family ATPase n=1 Tax=Hyphomonas pacifica TaxID=1280941 RepID=UPI001F3C6A3C|nr:FliI/YscN family ATPase [Hyphomonas pacifica]
MLTSAPNFPDRTYKIWGTVRDVSPGMLSLAGISEFARLGNEIRVMTAKGDVYGEVLSISGDSVTAMLYGDSDAIHIGDRVTLEQQAFVEPGDHWLGKIVDYRGLVVGEDTKHTAMNTRPRPLRGSPPANTARKSLGDRLSTGWMITDTILPICRGQRLGLFAGSGVGKSTFLGSLASGVKADRVVIALVGERSREVNEFVHKTLPKSVLSKTVIVAATANEPPGAKKRAALCAVAAAEHFRDEGHQVLFLFDSITRFAEAHREVSLAAGETPALNAFPPSTVRAIAEVAERTGPGTSSQGDITAIFSVLVAGSDMEEPVADMVRGLLDGHIILSREISERGRYPAIDVLRSVSRSLPHAASDTENDLIKDYRRTVALYEEIAPMLRANLYEKGHDMAGDRAIALWPNLDAFVSTANTAQIPQAFEVLQNLLSPKAPKQKVESV